MLNRHNDRNIKDVIGEFIKTNKNVDKGYSTLRIKNAWTIEMGEIINSYTEKMYFRNGTLTVYLTSAPLRSELSMSKQKVMDLINAACQERLITELILR